MTEEQRKTILLFQLTSDIFFSKVLEDKAACEEVINIITGKEIKLKQVKSQCSIRQLASHSVVLDILATEEMDIRIHLEMHPQNNEDHMTRIRYNTACVDVEILEKSTDYEELSDVYGIYEYYINLNGKCDIWEQTELLKYMVNADGILEHKAFHNLVKRVRFLKEENGGVEIMCEILEREREIGEEIGETNLIHNLMESMEVTLNQAMNLLQISQEKQEKYTKLLNGRL